MHNFIFESPAMQAVVETAKSIGTKNVPILLSGETGTGKEVLAHILHTASKRSGLFVPVNCAALPKDLVEAELFGSVRGAYTGATLDREGLIMRADGGTLFLDELNELPHSTQAKLLRVLQDKRVRPVGKTTEIDVNFKLIVALNVDPQVLVDRRKLRLDLFYRINVINLRLPPLRERMEDILPLATMFLDHYASEYGTAAPTLHETVRDILLRHAWPGNVRQLQNEMMRLSALYTGEIKVNQLSASIMLQSPSTGPINLAAAEKTLIEEALVKYGGRKDKACQALGIGRQTLYNKIKHYGLGAWVETGKGQPKDRKRAALSTNGAVSPDSETAPSPKINLL